MTEPTLVPLSTDRHGSARWRRFADYGFARGRRLVPVVAAEAETVAAALPLVFADTPEGGPPMPVALLRSRAAGNSPYVSAEGRWLANYVPALLRVHPFSSRAVPDESGRMVLLVDEASGLITDDAMAERFFDPLGAPTPSLEAVIAFFRQYEASVRQTRAAMDALTGARTPDGEPLLVPLAGIGGIEGEGAAGLWMIHRARFDALDDAGWLALRGPGALALAHAHLVGRWKIDFLRRAEEAIAGLDGGAAAMPRGNTGPESGPDMSEFLAAMAGAQDDAIQGLFGTTGQTETTGTGPAEPSDRARGDGA